jgi:Caspase domain
VIARGLLKTLAYCIAGVGAALLVGVLFSAEPAHAEKRVALVIGNDGYPNLGADRQLLTAVNDAQAVGDALARIGFTVIRGANLGRQGMIDKLAKLTSQLHPGDTAAFFFAGHGVAINDTNYLIPSDVPAVTPDAEARVRGDSISDAEVVAELETRGVRVALLVLDACRDNPFPRTATRSIGNTRGLVDAKPARGVFTIYSAGIGQTALDRLGPNDPNRDSVFTRVFIDELTKPGIDLASLAIDTRERVAQLALQAKDGLGQPAPHDQTPAYYDQTVGGRIYLAGLPGSGSSAPQSADPAAQAWQATQNTTSVTILKAFIQQFGNSPYGSMARARVEELKRAQVAALSPTAVVPAYTLPNAPLPTDVPLDPAVLRLVETDPFFAGAPPVVVRSYDTSAMMVTTMRGPAATMTTDNAAAVKWLRQGLIQYERTEQNATIQLGSRFPSTSVWSEIAAANGLIDLGQKQVYDPGKADTTTATYKLISLNSLSGHVFPVAVGNQFAYVAVYRQRSSNLNDDYTQSISCRIRGKYPANIFHANLPGDAYLAVCSVHLAYKRHRSISSNGQWVMAFFGKLGLWLDVDPATASDRIAETSYSTPQTRTTTTTILKSFALVR